MKIKELYNALEKAIDSGEATLETNIWIEGVDECCKARSTYIDQYNDFMISAT